MRGFRRTHTQMLDIRALRRGSDGAEPSTPSEPVSPRRSLCPRSQSRVHLPLGTRTRENRYRLPHLSNVLSASDGCLLSTRGG